MVNIWDSNSSINPDNGMYLGIAKDLYMEDWRKCKEMYLGLDPNVRQELDIYLVKVRHMEIWQDLRELAELKKQQSRIPPITFSNRHVA
ncbi:MAG: hypothetical protein WC533_03185 [Candidatus Pacearchaeota archaeon]